MATNQLAAKKYALAAFNAAKKLNLIDQFLSDLGKFSALFSPSTIKELSNPQISKVDLKKTIADLGYKLSLHGKVISFLEIIVDGRRIANIPAIHHNFVKLVKIEKNILDVEVISAKSLDVQNAQELKLILEKKYAVSAVEIKQSVKKDILGGLQIKVGSTMIDASLKAQLFSLNQQLQSII